MAEGQKKSALSFAAAKITQSAKFKFQAREMSKRAADGSAEGDAVEKKQIEETFPDTIFEEEAQRLLDEKIKEWRRKKSVQDVVDKIKEILKDQATAQEIDRVRFEDLNRVYMDTIRLEKLFADRPLCDDKEPTRVLSWCVKEAVANRLLQVIESVDEVSECKRYLQEHWFASTKRPKDRPSLKKVQEEARKKELWKLATLLGKLPALWKEFKTKYYPPVKAAEDSEDDD